MKVDFRDICGKSYNLEIPNNANVADACKYLSQKTGIQENKIFLVSTNSNLNFYQDNEQMIDILKENPEYIIFMKAFINDQNQMNSTLERFENQEATNQDFEQNSNQIPNDITYSQQNLIGKREQILNKSLKFPQKSFFNAIQSAKNWRYNDLYDDYSYVVNEVPHDIQFKVEQLAELGYHIEDIKEALRATNYKVSLAIHFLMLHHATNDNNNDYYTDDSYIYDSENENDDSDIEYFDYAFNDNEQAPNEKANNDANPNEKANDDAIHNEKVSEKNNSTEKIEFNTNSNEKTDNFSKSTEKVDDTKDFNGKSDEKQNVIDEENKKKINKNEEKKSPNESGVFI